VRRAVAGRIGKPVKEVAVIIKLDDLESALKEARVNE
jgi:hypothetical protein